MNEAIRDLGFLAWKNDLAWMEAMKGPDWKRTLAEERRRFKAALSEPDVKAMIPMLQDELEKTRLQESDGTFEAAGGEIHILPDNTQSIRWKMKDAKKWEVAVDLDASPGGKIWLIRDTGEGSSDFVLEHVHKGKRQWSKSSVGPNVGIRGGRCYYLEADVLWNYRLCSVEASTGKDRRVHFEEQDPRWDLELVRLQGGQLLMRAHNAGKQSLWEITQSGCRRLWLDGESFVPVTATSSFVRARGHRAYELRGPLAKSFRMPNLKKYTPEEFHLATATLVTRRYGVRTVWKCDAKSVEKIQTVLGEVHSDPWTSSKFLFTCPGARPYFGQPDTQVPPDHVYGKSEYKIATSRDGTRVPYVLVRPLKKGHGGLFVTGYGAYGMASSPSTQRWKPLLDRGWSILTALIRGGGDHDDAWAEAARRDNKVRSVEDLEACIAAGQKVTGIPAASTVVFGRSAGGYLVGATLNRHPRGDLFGAVYAEVPYVDVLRTTTNPNLPLTKVEYEEFGRPAERLGNLDAILRLSPVDGIPLEGIPDIFVLCRTGTTDQQVLAYESVKWIKRLRSDKERQPKLLMVAQDEGHFPPMKTLFHERAADLALLLAWLDTRKKSKPQIYDMAKGNGTRKNRKNERKSRKNERKNRKANRKSRKTERKNRKTNRK